MSKKVIATRKTQFNNPNLSISPASRSITLRGVLGDDKLCQQLISMIDYYSSQDIFFKELIVDLDYIENTCFDKMENTFVILNNLYTMYERPISIYWHYSSNDFELENLVSKIKRMTNFVVLELPYIEYAS